jgi:hypothetical protein
MACSLRSCVTAMFLRPKTGNIWLGVNSVTAQANIPSACRELSEVAPNIISTTQANKAAVIYSLPKLVSIFPSLANEFAALAPAVIIIKKRKVRSAPQEGFAGAKFADSIKASAAELGSDNDEIDRVFIQKI